MWVSTNRPLVAAAVAHACRGAGVKYRGELGVQGVTPARVPGALVLDRSAPDAATGDWEAAAVLLLAPLTLDRGVEAALRRGVDAMITVADGLEELVRALRSLADEVAHVSPRGARLLLDHARAGSPPVDRRIDVELSPRERDVLQAMVDGLSIKGTARELGLAVKTVEAHRRRLFDRLGVRTRSEAVTLALTDAGVLRRRA